MYIRWAGNPDRLKIKFGNIQLSGGAIPMWVDWGDRQEPGILPARATNFPVNFTGASREAASRRLDASFPGRAQGI